MKSVLRGPMRKGVVAEGRMYPQLTSTTISSVIALPFFLAALLAVYSSTILHPYLLTDETWIVRPDTAWWELGMGRPIFSWLASLAERVTKHDVIYGIYAMRFSAIGLLALSASALMWWLQIWGQTKLSAAAIALAVMTLPSFQIIVADGTQLALAIFLAIFTTDVCYRYRFSWIGYFVSGVSLMCALLIYQQQILVAIAMLAIPLLRRRADKDMYRFIILYGGLVTLVSMIFFFVWRILYQIYWPGRVDHRYGPAAVGLPSLHQMRDFVTLRLEQIANLWDVHFPHLNLGIGIVAALIFFKVAWDFFTNRRLAMIGHVFLLGILIGADSFRLVAHAYPSYVTATALSLVVFYWAWAGLEIILTKFSFYGACALAIGGSFFAYTTVRNDIAIPNWQNMQEIRRAITDHPHAIDFHILGSTFSSHNFQEFSWKNSLTDVYLYLSALDVADYLGQRNELGQRARGQINFSVGHVEDWASPTTTPSKIAAGSVMIKEPY